VESEDLEIDGRVRVQATLMSMGRQDSLLEQIVSQLGVEPGVSAASWRCRGTRINKGKETRPWSLREVSTTSLALAGSRALSSASSGWSRFADRNEERSS
jgi:hypothetical protein